MLGEEKDSGREAQILSKKKKKKRAMVREREVEVEAQTQKPASKRKFTSAEGTAEQQDVDGGLDTSGDKQEGIRESAGDYDAAAGGTMLTGKRESDKEAQKPAKKNKKNKKSAMVEEGAQENGVLEVEKDTEIDSRHETDKGLGTSGMKKKKKKKEEEEAGLAGHSLVAEGGDAKSNGKHEVEREAEKTLKKKETKKKSTGDEGAQASGEIETQKETQKPAEKRELMDVAETTGQPETNTVLEMSGKKKTKKRERKSSGDGQVAEWGQATSNGAHESGRDAQIPVRKEKEKTMADGGAEKHGVCEAGMGLQKPAKKRVKATEETVVLHDIDKGVSTSGKKRMQQERESKSAGDALVAEGEEVMSIGKHGNHREAAKPARKKKKAVAETGDLKGDNQVHKSRELDENRKEKKKKKKDAVKGKILRSEVGDGHKDARTVVKTKKKVRFQEPEMENKEEVPSMALDKAEDKWSHEDDYNWRTDVLKPGMIYGRYSKEEDEILKQTIYDYIQERGWEREDGLEKVLHPGRHKETRGCWKDIRKCLPFRTLKRLNSRARRLLMPGVYLGKWKGEEAEALRKLVGEHGYDWKKIGELIGRDSYVCKDKWRIMKSPKKGPWSQAELEQLCELVQKSLYIKSQIGRGDKRDHRQVRDNLNWEFIAEKLGGRHYRECLQAWYRRLASPLVSSGDWANADDQLLLQRLFQEFPLSEDSIEWNSLLEHRSGELCRKRWEQMKRSLGERRKDLFHNQLEITIKRYAPYLLEGLDEYGQKFAEEMQAAEAEGEGNFEDEEEVKS